MSAVTFRQERKGVRYLLSSTLPLARPATRAQGGLQTQFLHGAGCPFLTAQWAAPVHTAAQGLEFLHGLRLIHPPGPVAWPIDGPCRQEPKNGTGPKKELG